LGVFAVDIDARDLVVHHRAVTEVEGAMHVDLDECAHMCFLCLPELRPAVAACTRGVVKLVVRLAKDFAEKSSCRVDCEDCSGHGLELGVAMRWTA
jgi:hypothetical protein